MPLFITFSDHRRAAYTAGRIYVFSFGICHCTVGLQKLDVAICHINPVRSPV